RRSEPVRPLGCGRAVGARRPPATMGRSSRSDRSLLPKESHAMSRNAVETVMGAVVLVVAAVFLFFAYTTTKVTAGTGNIYTAQFSRVDGIRDGTDVRINGIKVGQVVSQTLDPKTFYAVVKISVDPNIQ